MRQHRSKGFGEYVNWKREEAPHKVRYPATKQEVAYKQKHPEFL